METLPAIPLAEWRPTKETLHRYLQVVGKIRLAASARRNHWWNVPFHLTGRGLTTRPMSGGEDDRIFTIDLDLVAHELQVAALDGRSVRFSLVGRSVASFHDQTLSALDELGVPVRIPLDHPFDLPDQNRPFTEDTEHRVYEAAHALRYWQVLSRVNLLLERFSAEFRGKISPVHHFWHTFDIAVTRFRGRPVPQSADTDPVTREAYSEEVISAGFWFGDDRVPEPTFYSYTAPEPEGLTGHPLEPAAARWVEGGGGSHLAVLPYDAVRTAPDAEDQVLAFYRGAYRAGAASAGWDVDQLACPAGITDPVLARS
ncbi:hypothetical protein C1701_16250 [Actinoalloteichus sp. AHMU CJ021]|uniref:Ava_C0101 and related proteins n=1 Tax=Actinoalloteichus caeruleus DSM 43889 TaxID=1120930 RepID=A0ABT1JQ59_ACTCY|nr:DUF5996 family protein [Actinoalloteichus caeruleus]AUS79644.1 hypothetical protein C1701_16250 [Actinoalloteichus sp. AHMU CJ021]MCP2333821.1 hypothetical protein [Actinoalloteichus caeruleus DSM 43889]